MQENETTYEDDLKDEGLDHLLQQESTNQIMNLILQNRHYGLLDEYIVERDDYVDWLQWAAIEESEKLKGVSVIMHVLNPMHLDHANMQ